MFFDGDNSKCETYDNVNDMQLRFGHWATADTDIDGGGVFATAAPGIEFVNLDTDLGWNLEVKFPLANLQMEDWAWPPEFGFEAQMNDNDGSMRESVSKWWTEVGDPSWNNATGWGTAYLSYQHLIDKRNYPRTPVKVNRDICSGVKNRESGGVVDFGLEAAFPNPFNPITTIKYRIPAGGWTRLSVYSASGREVAVPVDGNQPRGTHAIAFDAAGLPSGVYFCKLRTLDRMDVRKMTLVK